LGRERKEKQGGEGAERRTEVLVRAIDLTEAGWNADQKDEVRPRSEKKESAGCLASKVPHVG